VVALLQRPPEEDQGATASTLSLPDVDDWMQRLKRRVSANKSPRQPDQKQNLNWEKDLCE